MEKKKITLETLADHMQKMDERMTKGFASLDDKIDKLDARMESGFAAVAEDISQLATKEQIIALHTQVTGIETDIKTTKGYKLPSRMADVEEELFGKARG